LKQPARLREKLANAAKKLRQTDSGQLQGIKGQLTELIEFSQDILRGNYQTLDVKTPVMVIAAILYFLLPLDSIPDFILGLGYLDDVTVITFVYRQLRTNWKSTEHGEPANRPKSTTNPVISGHPQSS